MCFVRGVCDDCRGVLRAQMLIMHIQFYPMHRMTIASALTRCCCVSAQMLIGSSPFFFLNTPTVVRQAPSELSAEP